MLAVAMLIRATSRISGLEILSRSSAVVFGSWRAFVLATMFAQWHPQRDRRRTQEAFRLARALEHIQLDHA